MFKKKLKQQQQQQVELIIQAKEFTNSAEIVKEIKKTYPDLLLIKHNNPVEKEFFNSISFI